MKQVALTVAHYRAEIAGLPDDAVIEYFCPNGHAVVGVDSYRTKQNGTRVCRRCERKRRLNPNVKRRKLAKAKKNNSHSLETATRRYEPWTGPELEMVARPDFTARELAPMIGRTVFSIYNQRHLLAKEDPKRIYLLGATGQNRPEQAVAS